MMANLTKMGSEFSPLDQIRQTEAEVTRQVAAAREQSELAIAKTKARVREILNEAREAGRREGQIRYREIVSTAEEEAQALVAQAHKRVEVLHLRGNRCMEIGVRHAVNIILGMEGVGKDL